MSNQLQNFDDFDDEEELVKQENENLDSDGDGNDEPRNTTQDLSQKIQSNRSGV